MTKEERQTRSKALREQLANLSAEQKQALIDRGLIATIEGRVLSGHNTILLYLQSNGRIPTVVGGYRQWLKAGRQVQKGQHGSTIWFPVGPKDEEGTVQAESFYTATV